MESSFKKIIHRVRIIRSKRWLGASALFLESLRSVIDRLRSVEQRNVILSEE